MAVNEKQRFARVHLVHGGRLYEPGELLTGRMPEYAIDAAAEAGNVLERAPEAEEAKKVEAERKADVAEQIKNRSEKRTHNAA